MAWIREEEIQAPAIRRVMSIIPSAMEAIGNASRAITFGASTLTRVQEESIAVTVSMVNRCQW